VASIILSPNFGITRSTRAIKIYDLPPSPEGGLKILVLLKAPF